MKKHAIADPLLNIQAFVDGTRGQITIGEIPPIRSAALAAVDIPHRMVSGCHWAITSFSFDDVDAAGNETMTQGALRERERGLTPYRRDTLARAGH